MLLLQFFTSNLIASLSFIDTDNPVSFSSKSSSFNTSNIVTSSSASRVKAYEIDVLSESSLDFMVIHFEHYKFAYLKSIFALTNVNEC